MEWIDVVGDDGNSEKMTDDGSGLGKIASAFPFQKIVAVAFLIYFQIEAMKRFEDIVIQLVILVCHLNRTYAILLVDLHSYCY